MMIVHENIELLSSFVDDELEPPLRRAVESHLEDCSPCRARLAGLRRVVDELRVLQAAPPPTELSGQVRRAVLFDSGRTSVLRRTEDSLRRWTAQPLLLPLFGVVTAMAVLLYLFSAWSGGSETAGTRLIVPAPGEAGSAGPRATEVRPQAAEVRRIAGRTFRRDEARWVEEGVDPAAATATLDLVRPIDEHAELEGFRPLGGRVFLQRAGTVIEVVFGPDG